MAVVKINSDRERERERDGEPSVKRWRAQRKKCEGMKEGVYGKEGGGNKSRGEDK